MHVKPMYPSVPPSPINKKAHKDLGLKHGAMWRSHLSVEEGAQPRVAEVDGSSNRKGLNLAKHGCSRTGYSLCRKQASFLFLVQLLPPMAHRQSLTAGFFWLQKKKLTLGRCEWHVPAYSLQLPKGQVGGEMLGEKAEPGFCPQHTEERPETDRNSARELQH